MVRTWVCPFTNWMMGLESPGGAASWKLLAISRLYSVGLKMTSSSWPLLRPSRTLTFAFASSCAMSRASLPPSALALDAHASLHLPPKVAPKLVHIDRYWGRAFTNGRRRRDRLCGSCRLRRAIGERHRRHGSRRSLRRDLPFRRRPGARALHALRPDKRVLSAQARPRHDSRALRTIRDSKRRPPQHPRREPGARASIDHGRAPGAMRGTRPTRNAPIRRSRRAGRDRRQTAKPNGGASNRPNAKFERKRPVGPKHRTCVRLRRRDAARGKVCEIHPARSNLRVLRRRR